MAVKRIGAKGKTKAKPRTSASSQSNARIALPSQMVEPEDDFRKYVTLIYGQSGVGKTTLAASWPDAVFLPTEPGTKGLKRWEIPTDGSGIQSWRDMRDAIDLLCDTAAENDFQTVIIDTFDRAYDYCMAWTCEQLGIEHVSEDASGKRDRSGKGWTELKKEFIDQMIRLINAGYGLVLTSHAKTMSVVRHSGEEYDLIIPSCSGQALDVAKKITDCIFYGEFVKRAGDSDDVQRILITQGDDLVLAKARGGDPTAGWPRYVPMLKERGYALVRDAFLGKAVGIDPQSIVLSKQTASAAVTSIRLDKAKERKGGAKKKSLKKK